jgi:hypothetical protein
VSEYYAIAVARRYSRTQIPREVDINHATPRVCEVFKPVVRGTATPERDRQAEGRALTFLFSAANGNSELDLERLRSVRDRAWR